MRVKQVRLAGFKSFREATHFTFDTPITAIVGPNGSGKSNVVEAVRFVLGEQSMKSLRSGVGTDLIFRGHDQVRPLARASASITFDNHDRVFVLHGDSDHSLSLDFDEITIEREVSRDGSNTYKINDSAVRLKDVHELIASVNIGTSSHHIISQGQSDRLLRASPKERKEMLEDALGLKVYQYRIKESTRKLERAEENLLHVEELRKQLLPELRFLKKQVDQMEQAQRLREGLAHQYREYLKQTGEYLKRVHIIFSEEVAGHTKALADIEKEKKQLQYVSEKSVHSADSLRHQEISERIASIQEEKQSLLRESGRIEGMIEALEHSIKKHASEQSSSGAQSFLRIDVSVWKKELKNLQQLVRDIFSANTDTQKETALKASEQILEALVSHVTQERKNETSSVVEETQRLEEFRRKLEHIQKEIARVLADEHTTQSAMVAHEASRENERDAEREASRKLLTLSQQESTERVQYERSYAKLHEIQDKQRRYQEEIKEADVLLGPLVKDFETLEVSKDLVEYNEHTYEQFSHELETQRREIEKQKIRLESLGADGHHDVHTQYKKLCEQDEQYEKEIMDVSSGIESLKEVIADLTERLAESFEEGITKIGEQFHRFFLEMFGGGSASLTVVDQKKSQKNKKEDDLDVIEDSGEDDSLSPETGVVIEVALPRKKVRELSMLSGGERSLVSIALLFALSAVNPPPFLILDETDAALDEANSRRYGEMLELLSKEAQLILVTHNRQTMARAGVLYGVTLNDKGASQLLSVKLTEAIQYAK